MILTNTPLRYCVLMFTLLYAHITKVLLNLGNDALNKILEGDLQANMEYSKIKPNEARYARVPSVNITIVRLSSIASGRRINTERRRQTLIRRIPIRCCHYFFLSTILDHKIIWHHVIKIITGIFSKNGITPFCQTTQLVVRNTVIPTTNEKKCFIRVGTLVVPSLSTGHYISLCCYSAFNLYKSSCFGFFFNDYFYCLGRKGKNSSKQNTKRSSSWQKRKRTGRVFSSKPVGRTILRRYWNACFMVPDLRLWMKMDGIHCTRYDSEV